MSGNPDFDVYRLPDDHEAVREAVRAVAEDKIAPYAAAVDEELAAPLRAGDPPVIGVIRDGRLLLDCRTLTDAEAEEVAAAVAAARG